MHRCTESAAGGMSQRLYPSGATVCLESRADSSDIGHLLRPSHSLDRETSISQRNFPPISKVVIHMTSSLRNNCPVDRVTVWDDRCGADGGARLAPGRPRDLARSPDVLVVGGGAIGLAAAVFARRAGLGRVVLIERAPRLVPGASSGNGGAI